MESWREAFSEEETIMEGWSLEFGGMEAEG